MFVCGIPRNLAEFSNVFSVGEDQFGELSISLKMAKQIFAFRPEIFLAIIAENGSVAAYSSVYPLKKKWADAIIAGDIAEPDLIPEMLLSRQDALEGSFIYIGSIVIGSKYDPFSRAIFLASLMSWRAQQLQNASVKRITAIMTPVTKHGHRLARRIGAQRLGTETDVNNHCIYGRKISPGFLYRITSSMDVLLSKTIVTMNLDFRPSLLPTSISPNRIMAVPQSLDYV